MILFLALCCVVGCMVERTQEPVPLVSLRHWQHPRVVRLRWPGAAAHQLALGLGSKSFSRPSGSIRSSSSVHVACALRWQNAAIAKGAYTERLRLAICSHSG